MNALENIFLWLGILGYILAFVLSLAGLAFARQRAVTTGSIIIMVAFAFHTLAILSRWMAIGHVPAMGVYENSLLGAWFLLLIFLLCWKWFPNIKPLGVVVAPIALVMLGNGIMRGAELQPLEPAFQSNWLFVHITFAWLAYGSFLVAACLGIGFLWKKRTEVHGQADGSLSGKLPQLPILDNLIFRFIVFGFIADTAMIATGSIWAQGLWGRYWGWDPIETWSLVSWLIYGAVLHLRVTMGWKNRKMAWLSIGSVLTVIITFFGIGFISGVHTRLM